MVRHAQRHRTTTLPYRYRSDALDFELEEYSVDGKLEEIDLLPGQTRVDVAPGSREEPTSQSDAWSRVTLFGRIDVPDDLLEDLFPSDERDAPPAKLYVAVRCYDTIYRDKVIVTEAPTTPGTYDVKIRLDWDTFRNEVELRPYLVRTDDREGDGPYATERHVKVASGTRYEVVVDHLDDDEPAAIDGEEVSFSQSHHLPDGDKLYYLDFRNEARPKLWINADHPRIADVLRTDGSVGAEARMRDVVLDQISYGVWSQLVVRAATAIDRHGGVEHEWQETVLEAFAVDLYDVDDIDDAKQLLREDVRDPEALARLTNRLDTELQEFIDPRTQLLNLMEEGLRI